MNRHPLLGGLTLIALAASLVGCDPNKSNPPATPGAATSAGGGSTAPTAASDSSSGKPADIAGAPKYKIITNGISPFWDSMSKGLYQADNDLKVNGDWQAPNPADHNAQVKIFQDAIAAKNDGIALSVIEADAMVGTINEAMSQGIPVITFDSDSEHSNRLAYIGTINYQAGKVAGEAAAKLFPNGGKLVAFVGNMGAQNAHDRYQGFTDALKSHPNITFLQAPFEDNKDKGRARKNVEDAITRYQAQGLNGLVGLYSYNGPAIVDAVMQANLRDKMKIICFDGEPETLSNLGKGLVDVTVVQKPYEFGRLSIMLLNDIKKEGGKIDPALKDLQPELDKLHMKLDPIKHIIDTGVDVITPANAKEFLQKLKEKGLEST